MRERTHEILAGLEAIAAGDLKHTLPLSDKGDELDAIAYGINVLADEVRLARNRR